jgi:hypothetical protein
MFTTTLTASWELLLLFLDKASMAVDPAEAFTFKLDAFLVSIMALLAITVLIDMMYKLYLYASGKVKISKKELP